MDMVPSEFLCDVGHRIKCMAKPLFSLANLSNRLSTRTKSDAMRMKKTSAGMFDVIVLMIPKHLMIL